MENWIRTFCDKKEDFIAFTAGQIFQYLKQEYLDLREISSEIVLNVLDENTVKIF